MGTTYAVAVGVVKGLELDDVWVSHYTHDLQLSVLYKSQYRMIYS